MNCDKLIMCFKVSILLAFICCLFVGCTSVPDELINAERIIDTHPDSALFILQHLKPEKNKSNSSRALYGLLLFHALERADKKMQPDSVINFSISYFKSKNDIFHLANCYFYKGHMFKHAQRYDEATVLYLKALGCLKNNNPDFDLSGKIYSDLGDICSIQSDYKESLNKFKYSIDCFNHAGNKIAARFVLLSIGRTYHFLKDYKTAQHYYQNALVHTNDSLLSGAVYQEMGSNYYWNKQYDSAQYYLRKSLHFPFRSTGFAIRNFNLADLKFDIEQYDSSFYYATRALKYPANFYTQRDCYRILVNIEYTRKKIKEMSIFMSHYQDCTDSIQKIKLQTKSSVLEKLYHNNENDEVKKKNMILLVSVLLIILLLFTFLILFLYKRNKLKRKQLDAFKQQFNIKQEFVSQGFIHKIEKAKALQAEFRKNVSVEVKEKLDKELYNSTLHLNNWDDFNLEMNQTFNNIIVKLKSDYPAVNNKEIIWCCLHLLEIPHADRMLLLETTSDSLYKLKQRLAHKLNLETTKELDSYLKSLIAITD